MLFFVLIQCVRKRQSEEEMKEMENLSMCLRVTLMKTISQNILVLEALLRRGGRENPLTDIAGAFV